jgi:hypothetical protein
MRWASRTMMSTSAATCAPAPGRCTFSTTLVPSNRVPVCTCATDAAASGVSLTSVNTVSSGAPISDSITARIAGHGRVVARDCNEASARV